MAEAPHPSSPEEMPTEAFSMKRTDGAGFDFDSTGKITYKDGVKDMVEESKEKIMSGEIVPESVREKDK